MKNSYFITTFLISLFSISSSIKADEITKTKTGYKLEFDAPSGETRFAVFTDNNLFDKAKFKFDLTQKHTNLEWPPALNIQFENEEYEAILLWSFLNADNKSNFVLETALWANNKKYPEPMTINTGFSNETEMEISLEKGPYDGYSISVFANTEIKLPDIKLPELEEVISQELEIKNVDFPSHDNLLISDNVGIIFERNEEKFELLIKSGTLTRVIKGAERDITPSIIQTTSIESNGLKVAFLNSWTGGNCGTGGYVVSRPNNRHLQLDRLEGCGNWTLLSKNKMMYYGYNDMSSYTHGLCGTANSRGAWVHIPRIYQIGNFLGNTYRELPLEAYINTKEVKKKFISVFEFIRKNMDISKVIYKDELKFCGTVQNDSSYETMVNEYINIRNQ